ncbi:MAG: hypothetical protein KC646_11315 [Candidatus Cloacimonetes bacterium]|nr:hypothetical protein [Candidatus Cloacimonadota bacterium]
MIKSIIFTIIFSTFTEISSAQTAKEALFKFCSEIESLDTYQRIVNFTELSMDKTLIKDLLFLKNPRDSYSYEKNKVGLARIPTIIDIDGNSRFTAYLKSGKVYKYESDFVFKSKRLYLDIKKKQRLWSQLLNALPESKTIVKTIDKNGKLEIIHLSMYEEYPLKIQISIKSHNSKVARFKVLFGS